MEEKYLQITIHDRDFTSSLELVANLLYDTFFLEDGYPTETDFPVLKEVIKHLWFGADMVQDLIRWKGKEINTPSVNYFEPHLEFVDCSDIPDWDNGESIYIPMFDDSKILRR